ncbi:MAG: PIN domain-containing protein [Wenzhouxiangellaceae bacterium]|nr:PIN domain-containing protein [Wenzhouxiangellaceae bacterium]
MTGSVFVDTNVLVYARDASEPEKQPRAQAWMDWLWSQQSGRISTQVFQEYYQIVTRKLQPGLKPGAARADVRDLGAWKPIPIDGPLIEKAWTIEDRYRYSWWDSLILAAACQAGCDILLTENLAGGQQIENIRIVNPFDVSPPGSE